jgi:Ca2+-transporting ATPase
MFILTLLKQFNDPTIYLLLIAVALSLFLKEFIDAVIIIIVLIINSFVGAIQEYKAEKALDSLKKLSSPHAGVIRESKLYKVLASEIVLGDIIYLQEGDIVPSDILLFDINNLEVDESLLTGESLPVRKKYIDKDLSSLSLSLQDNMAFMSTRVIKGNAKGICIKRGMDSEVGKIANLIDDNKIKTPLQNRLVSLSKFLGVFTIIIVLLVLLYSLVMKKNLIESFVFAISLAVAAIPEGLPAVVTIVLSLGVFKLVKVNALVRTLPSV